MISAFDSNSIDNLYLNKEKFNSAIKNLFYRFNLPTIAFTFLTDRLYEVVDESNDGKIQKDEFIEGMSKVLADYELRRKCKYIIFLYVCSKLYMHYEVKG